MCPLFIFSPNDNLSKTMKNSFYFMWKAHFALEIFKLLYFRPRHCFRGWSEINLKVYDVINCLNKNLKQSLFRLRSMFWKIPLLVMYYLTKFNNVTQSSFWVIPKITLANLCKPIHDIINHSIFICPFESGKCGKETKKLQKFECLKNKNSFLHEIESIFYNFWRAIIWWRNKNLIKIEDTSFKVGIWVLQLPQLEYLSFSIQKSFCLQ